MGLRCSILGHTFDETEVRRDRRERGSGNEVVTVVSQVERCSRCGTERVVSENKEVVSVVDADEVDLDEEGGAASRGGSTPPAPGGGTDVDPSPPGGETGTEAAGAGADGEAESESPTDPAEEDVEFITETEGSLGGGENVADETEVPDDAGDAGGGIDGMAARSGAFDGDDGSEDGDARASAEEDAEIIDAPESERAPGQWPDEPGGDEPWTSDDLDEGEGEAGTEPTTDPAPDVEPVAESSFTVPEGSLRCPDCGHEVSADSSFRAGDACPECQGYLEDPVGE
jgi:hypothetical protein